MLLVRCATEAIGPHHASLQSCTRKNSKIINDRWCLACLLLSGRCVTTDADFESRY